jgi:8-oxo-dGTP pyrophosphatase MutT (NUDIX family)
VVAGAAGGGPRGCWQGAGGAPGGAGGWVRHASEVVHANPWYRVRRDAVTRPGGARGDYFVAESSPAVFVVAADAASRVALVGLHRYSVGRWSLEVPAGSVEPGETPLDAARRELAEEAGLTASRWSPLGVLHPANGLLAEDDHVFLAGGIGDAGGHDQEAEGITELRWVDLAEALRMARRGEIHDGQTVAALAS